MTRDADGVWTVSGRPSLAQRPLPVRGHASTRPAPSKVEVNRVTDPYSRGPDHQLAAVRAGRPRTTAALKPAGWNRLAKPPLPKPENSTIYELHVRDFSINDATVPARAPGDVPGVHRPGQRRHAAPAAAGPVRA